MLSIRLTSLARSSGQRAVRTISSSTSLKQEETQTASNVEKPAQDARTPREKNAKPMNVAMAFYLERKRQHDAFIARERSEFELGKRHLANMMGVDADAMTQEDVDKAVEYLLPSGLREESARPLMKPPEEVRPTGNCAFR